MPALITAIRVHMFSAAVGILLIMIPRSINREVCVVCGVLVGVALGFFFGLLIVGSAM
jgi:hypothetical protein